MKLISLCIKKEIIVAFILGCFRPVRPEGCMIPFLLRKLKSRARTIGCTIHPSTFLLRSFI